MAKGVRTSLAWMGGLIRAPAKHQPPLLRFLILLTAQSAEGG